MRLVRAVFQKLYFVYAFIVFLAVMFLILPFAVISSFFGRVRGGNFIYRLCMLWGDIVFPLIFIFPKRIFEAPHDPTRSYIFVANHVSYLDAGVLVEAFRQPIRILAKAQMAKIPLFGFIYRKAVVSVDRTDTAHRAKSILVLISLIRKKISVLIFPEGTFNTTGRPLKEFFNGAFRVAIETNTPIKPVLFLDTFDRMPAAKFTSLTPGKCRLVFLDEIPVGGMTAKDVERLKDIVFERMEQKLREYKVSWVLGS
jgi:1-acyl-sn-glycerol-3-phosphate acyltransferase